MGTRLLKCSAKLIAGGVMLEPYVTLQDAIEKAIEMDEISILDLCFNQNEDIPDTVCAEALYNMVAKGNTNIVKYLCSKKEMSQYIDKDLISQAAGHGYTEIVKKLFLFIEQQHKAACQLEALMYAGMNNKSDIVEYLLMQGPHDNAFKERINLLYIDAINNLHIETMLCIEKYKTKYQGDDKVLVLLDIIASNEFNRFCEYLSDEKNSFVAKNSIKIIFHYATIKGYSDIMRYLLARMSASPYINEKLIVQTVVLGHSDDVLKALFTFVCFNDQYTQEKEIQYKLAAVENAFIYHRLDILEYLLAEKTPVMSHERLLSKIAEIYLCAATSGVVDIMLCIEKNKIYLLDATLINNAWKNSVECKQWKVIAHLLSHNILSSKIHIANNGNLLVEAARENDIEVVAGLLTLNSQCNEQERIPKSFIHCAEIMLIQRADLELTRKLYNQSCEVVDKKIFFRKDDLMEIVTYVKYDHSENNLADDDKLHSHFLESDYIVGMEGYPKRYTPYSDTRKNTKSEISIENQLQSLSLQKENEKPKTERRNMFRALSLKQKDNK